MSALKFIYPNEREVSREINQIACQMLDWELLLDEAADYIMRIMTYPDG